MGPQVLELHGLEKSFPHGGSGRIRPVQDVSLQVAAGEFVTIYGPSGSGKTTLLELIAGLQPPDRGRVIVDGQDITALSESGRAEYRRTVIGVVGHPENMIPGALAIENASLKLWLTDARSSDPAAEALLAKLGLEDRMRHRTEQLSMGERQRVLIARALLTNPKLVLADEPTGSLDTRRTIEILGLLRDQCRSRGAAVVLATHDPEAAAFADQTHTLRDGRLDRNERHETRGKAVEAPTAD